MTSNAVERFSAFFERFRSSNLWVDMVNTREDSPWHREENVGVHTRMLLDWYTTNLAWKRNENQQVLTLVSCLFHDVGKPSAEIVKFSEERGEYRAYHGHELISACLWIDYALSNFDMIEETLRLNVSDISNIAFFIEHHVPFATKDTKKLKALKNAFLQRVGSPGLQAWKDFLMSDQHGRVSDDQAEKLQRVDDWFETWEKI